MAALALAACDEEPAGNTLVEPVPARVSFDIDSVVVEVGSEVTLSPRVYDQSGSPMSYPPPGFTVRWSTSDSRIATVNEGIIRGIRTGRISVGVQVGTASAGMRLIVN